MGHALLQPRILRGLLHDGGRTHVAIVAHLLLLAFRHRHLLHLLDRHMYFRRWRGVLLLRRGASLCLCRRAPLLLLLAPGDFAGLLEEHVRSLHRHAAKVGDKVRAVGVAGDVAFRAPSCVLAPQRKHVAAVAAPVGTDVVDGLEAVRDAVVDLVRVIFLYRSVRIRHRRRIQSEMPPTPVFDFDIHLVTTF